MEMVTLLMPNPALHLERIARNFISKNFPTVLTD